MDLSRVSITAIVAAMSLAISGSAMGALIDHNAVTYVYDVALNANTPNRQDSTGDELADGIAASGGSAHDDPNMAYWQSTAPFDDPVWDGPLPTATFNLGAVYSELTSIQMWYGGWDASGIGGPHGIKVSVSLDDITYSTPVLYNSAPEGYPNNLNFSYHTATESIGYNASNFQYVRIEFQPVNDGSTQANFLAIGEVTFDGVAVPEPASLALIGLGGLMIFSRNKRK